MINHTITEPIQVEILKSWVDLDIGLSIIAIIVSFIGIVITLILVLHIGKQVFYQKELLKKQETDLELKNKIDSFKQFDDFYYNHLEKHNGLLNKIEDLNNKIPNIGLTNGELQQIERLLNDLEIFAIKYYNSKWRISLINQIVGATIKSVMNNDYVLCIIEGYDSLFKDTSLGAIKKLDEELKSI